jgi:hypothetical protein
MGMLTFEATVQEQQEVEVDIVELAGELSYDEAAELIVAILELHLCSELGRKVRRNAVLEDAENEVVDFVAALAPKTTAPISQQVANLCPSHLDALSIDLARTLHPDQLRTLVGGLVDALGRGV